MARLDPVQLTTIVMRVVVDCMKTNGVPINSPGDIDPNKTLSDNRPGGYGITFLRYLRICDCIEAALAVVVGRPVKLPAPWRKAHFGDTLGAFVSAIIIEIGRKPETAVAKHTQRLAKRLTS
jgi:hypothetical protein